MTTVGIQRLINHHTRAAWEWRAKYRAARAEKSADKFLAYLDGRYCEARETIEYLRAL